MDTKKCRWLDKKDNVQDATDDELARQLLTEDGNGVRFKLSCLVEIINRQHRREIHE